MLPHVPGERTSVKTGPNGHWSRESVERREPHRQLWIALSPIPSTLGRGSTYRGKFGCTLVRGGDVLQTEATAAGVKMVVSKAENMQILITKAKELLETTLVSNPET
jgi:hypothetical protein